MSVNVGLLAEYSRIFPDQHDTLDELLVGIPQKIIIKTGTFFLIYQMVDHKSTYWKDIVYLWFNQDTEDFAQDLYSRIYEFFKKEESELTVLSPISSLKMIQIGLEMTNSDQTKSDTQAAIDLFKLYLLLNESFTSLQNRSGEYIEKAYSEIQIGLLLLNMGFSTSDLVNYIYQREFFCQSVKACLLFAFIKDSAALKPHLNKFLEKYDIKTIQEYYGKVLPLIESIIKKEEKGFVEIKIEDNDDYAMHKDFLSKLSVQAYLPEEDVDFKVVRAHPLIEIEKDHYRVTHPLFFTDKLYKGLFFEFAKINAELPEEEQLNPFRSFYTTHFSESYLLYRVMKYCFKNKYLQLSGNAIHEMGIDGAPDYYIRDGNKIFLFENKDVLINAAVKENPLFEDLEKELKKKFLEDKKRPKAVKQLTANVEKVLSKTNDFDKGYKSNNVVVYPILVVHDIVYDCPGLNSLLQVWFNHEIEQIKQSGLNTDKVKPLIILNIDSLIRAGHNLNSGKITLQQMLEVYYENLNKIGKKYATEEQLKNALIRQYLPSSKVIDDWLVERYGTLLRYNRILEYAFDLMNE